MPIRALPQAPNRADPTTFALRADALIAALPGFVDDANALEQSLQLVATTGTSASSLTIGTGSRTLTTQGGKAWSVGSFVYIASAASVSNIMAGQVTAYNTSTGALTVNVQSTAGAGTFASWVIGLSAPRNGSETYSGQVSAGTFAINAAANVFWQIQGAGVVFNCDAYDYLSYDRTADAFAFFIGGTNRFYVDQFGPGRNDDASTANGLVRKSQLDALVPPGAILGFARTTAPAGWLKANGAAVAVASYPGLTAAIYCGDANNATAVWGYRCTGSANPSTTRSTTGAFIVLPDYRAEFPRGWDDGRGVDAGRSLWSWQAQEIQAHNHAILTNGQETGTGRITEGGPPNSATYYTENTGGAETRPRNLAALICIKF